MREQKEHCDHECVCCDYEMGLQKGKEYLKPPCDPGECVHDTRKHPTLSQQFNSTDLLLLANDEWKRRQERKHLNDNPAWVSGFIGGFLTNKKWARNYVNNIRSKGEQ